MNASLSNIRTGTANTFEHMATNFKLRVEGDGKVEPQLADGFKSVGFVEDISDRRMRAFVASHQELRLANLPYTENVKSTQEALAATLRPGWRIDALYGTGSDQKGVGVRRLQLVMDEPGAGSQCLNIQHYEGSELSLSTKCQIGRWSVKHQIEGKLDQNAQALNPDSIRELAYFENPSV